MCFKSKIKQLMMCLQLNKSQGPQSVYSYKSNLTSLRSVKTPMTMGQSSVKSHHSKWSLFKGKNKSSISKHTKFII